MHIIATAPSNVHLVDSTAVTIPSVNTTVQPVPESQPTASKDHQLYLYLFRPFTNESTLTHDHINIAEIEAIDINETKLTLMIYSYSSQNATFPLSNTIDGNYTTFGITYNSLPDLDSAVDNWVKYSIVGIANVCSIGTITIYNRVDCCQSSIIGSYLQVLDKSSVVNTFDFTTVEEKYVFTLHLCSAGAYYFFDNFGLC